MRILYVIDSLSASGAERSLAEMIGPLRQRGVSIAVSYLHERPGLRPELEALGTTVRCVRRSGLGSVGELSRLIRRSRPDLVHTTLFEADIAGRLASTIARNPVVSSLVNVAYGPEHFRIPNMNANKLRAARMLDASTARLTVRMHAISNEVARVMGQRLRYPGDRIDVVRRGRDPSLLGSRTPRRRRDARDRLGIADDGPVVLAAARQEHQKGLDVLLHAFASLRGTFPRARMFVAGRSGASTPQLEALVDHLGLGDSARFLGARADVGDLLCAADVFVLPSRWEGLGSVLLEAMALEAPIVATALPAVEEVVSHRDTAVLVPVEDPIALADAIYAVLKDGDTASEMARRARDRFAEHFTIDRIADEMVAFFERALAGAR